MRPFAVPLTALAVAACAAALPAASALAQSPAPAASAAPDFAYAPRRIAACYRPAYDGVRGVTVLIGGDRSPTNAVLIGPARAAAKMPAVLWVHWLGEPATTNHTEFLADAQALAQRGVVSLLVDMPWSQKDWFTALRAPDTDDRDTVDQVIALRRALDCLTAIPGVDATRIAYVGHDFGAMDGALLLAVDDRPSYAVLMAPTLSYWEWYLLGKQPADRAAYVARMGAFDLPAWLARGKQKATLLQFGADDFYVSQATALALRNAVPAHDRTFTSYKGVDHGLDADAVRTDRRTWLIKQLGV